MKIFSLLLMFLFYFVHHAFAQAPHYYNAIKIGGNQFETLDQIEMDKEGNRYLKIYTNSPILTFGSSNIPGSGSGTGIVVKIDRNNQILWQVRSALVAGGDYSIYPMNFYMDAQDNTYLTIYHTQNVTVLGQMIPFDPSLGTFHYSTLKISKSNKVVWSKKSTKYFVFSYFNRLPEKHIVLLRQMGMPKDTVNGFILSDTLAYMLKVDTTGKLVNARSLGKIPDTYNPINCTKDRIYFVGNYGNFDTTLIQVPPALANQSHGIIASLDTNFHLNWVRRSTIPPFEQGQTLPSVVTPAMDGGVWVGGTAYSTGSILFDSISVSVDPPSGYSNFYLVHYSREGKATRARIFGSNREDYFNGLSEDSIGNLIIAGASSGSFSMDGVGSPLAESGPFILKSDGKNLRAKWLKPLPGLWRNIVDAKVDLKGNIFSQGSWSFYFIPSDTPPLALDNFVLPLTPSAPGFPQQTDLFIARLGNCNLANPVLSGPSNQRFCKGDSLTLTCSPFQKYQWSTGDSTQSISVKKPGAYHCYIYDSLGCYARSQTVVVTETPIRTSSLSASICPGENFLGYDTAGTYTDTLISSLGCDSIRTLTLSIKPNRTFSQSIRLCKNQSLQVGTRIYTQPGIYFDTLTASNGCDSLITSTLNYDIPNDTIQLSAQFGVLAAPNQDSYQWLDCNLAFAPIVGETDSSFAPTVTGSYAVRVTKGVCADTSACLLVTSVSPMLSKSAELEVFPNPNSGKATVRWRAGTPGDRVWVSSLEGKVVLRLVLNSERTARIQYLPSGVYVLKVEKQGVKPVRVMVE